MTDPASDKASASRAGTSREERFRRATRIVRVGGIPIGGRSPISVQTMTKTKTHDVEATVRQIEEAAAYGCDIIRVTVNDKRAAEAIAEIVRRSPIPVVADIHFNHVFALASIAAGVAKVRINPGNIGSPSRVREVLRAAKERGVPIRIGVNSGSLEDDILRRHGHPTAEAMFESAMRHIHICEDFGFTDLVISVKSTDVLLTIEAYRLIAERTDYPLHLGVTEAGTEKTGTIKSAVGIGTLLAEGIGDTIRVSLTAEPWKEIEVGKSILRSLGLASRSVEIITCPTCGRLEVDLFRIAAELEARLAGMKKPLRIAVLGCAVNGPGEAREADIGVAAGKGEAILYLRGEILRRVEEEEIVDAVVEEAARFRCDD
ncbi:MAG: flavodoxin-dependent (E)-4-hydroxy-3-methylbut-2-enyl-diphosphate synthase [Bacteroidota bacterium]|nr:flavodoxin-dependent (E)-4-hydroxy-3-methylbut-2-enyl-diphosphate synthase [Bacteroidota bacterium]